jgi:hypothetical protein
MKKIIAAIFVFLSGTASASVITNYEAYEDIQNISKDKKIWVGTFECDSLKEEIINKIIQKGYNVVEKKDDADVKLIFCIEISMPKGNKAPFFEADEVYGKGFPVIPPSIAENSNDLSNIESPSASPGIDAGHVREGVAITDSQAGGIVVGIVGSLLGRLVHQNIADNERAPGVVKMGVEIVTAKEKKRFRVLGAANTPETPETLIDAVIDAGIQGIVDGVAATQRK